MIILDNLGNYKRGRLWINEVPFEFTDASNQLSSFFDVDTPALRKPYQICVEVSLRPREISNYGLLSLRYEPVAKSKKVEYNILYYLKAKELYEDNIALKSDIVYKGITKSYANAIAESIQGLKDTFALPEGFYLFDKSAQSMVGSSPVVFSTLTSILLRVLSNNLELLRDQEIKDIIADEINNPTFNIGWKDKHIGN